ncbi:MAG TPA: hypothetical protein VII49_00255 [Rhizomicrobium sp.]
METPEKSDAVTRTRRQMLASLAATGACAAAVPCALAGLFRPATTDAVTPAAGREPAGSVRRWTFEELMVADHYMWDGSLPERYPPIPEWIAAYGHLIPA